MSFDPRSGAALWQLIDTVACCSDIETVHRAAVTCLTRTLNVRRAAALAFDAGDVMRFVAWEGLSPEYRAAVDGHSPWTRDEPDATPVLVPDVTRSADLAGYRDVLQAEGIAALAFIPLRVGTSLLGKFMLYYDEPHDFTDGEVAIARSVAGQVAFALERYRVEAELRAAKERLELLAAASNILADSLDPDAALTRLAELAVPSLADYCVTYALDHDDSIRRVAARHARPEKQELVTELLRSTAPTLGDRVGIGAVIRTGEPVCVAEISDEMLRIAGASAPPGYLDALRALRPRSSIIVPLVARGRVVGAVSLTTADSGRIYGHDDLLLAEELAHRTGLLVDNARLYREARQAVGARDEMVAVLSHDLRNPIGAIVSACGLLEYDDDAEQRSFARTTIGRATAKMERLIDDLLDFARIDAGALVLQRAPIGLEDALRESVALASVLAAKRRIAIEVSVPPTSPIVHADRHRLGQVLANLLGNAVKFSPEDATVHAAVWVEGDLACLRVSDEGPGISAEVLPFIFDRFWQGERSHAGAGLGLAIAKGIVDAHGGCIEVDVRAGRGASFVVRLPVAEA